ncbi:MAG TPA: DNA methyltransferase [Polyangiaceae bacterium]
MPGDLYYGDNLDVMRRHVSSESVDLIYLDPPFNSDQTYNIIHKGSRAQERAFVDTWSWDDKAEAAFRELTDRIPAGVSVPPELTALMLALKEFLYRDRKDLLAYLSMMAIRLVEMRRVLRPTGSLYLHCDPNTSPYLRLLLDAIFGSPCFRNEVVWRYRRWPTKAMRFQRMHDVLLFYTARAGRDHTFHTLYGYEKLAESTLKTFGTKKQRADFSSGHRKPSVEETESKGPPLSDYWDIEDEPMAASEVEDDPRVPLSDAWEIKVIAAIGKERTGYPTQKPLPLLRRVLEASSNPGDLVLDPFCGCGTTVHAAEEMGRRWKGIDIAIRAIDVIKDRLDAKFSPRVWTEHGEPADVEQAMHLAESNAYDFQWWAVRQLGGRPPKGEKKKGGDGGIDGELTLIDGKGVQRRGVVSVKGGRTLTPDFVKALSETVRQEKADFGILLTMHEPTQGMRDTARECGMASWADDYGGKLAHRIRIITVPELMARQVQWPGKLERPRTQSAPPPPEARPGETLSLPFAPRAPSTKKAKVRRPGTAKTTPDEGAPESATARPPKK